jgi:hypothetical protein
VNQNRCFQGVIPVGKGFLLSEDEVEAFLRDSAENKKVIKLFSMGANLARNPNGIPDRWIIDFNDMVLEEACQYAAPFERIRSTVKPEQSSTLKGDTRYTHNTCFETFPFPKPPPPISSKPSATKALQLHHYRSEQMEQKQWGITKLYNAYFDEPASQLYKLHKELDALVLQAYGFSPDDDLLEKLLALNLELAEKEKNGEAVVGPWDPTKGEP